MNKKLLSLILVIMVVVFTAFPAYAAKGDLSEMEHLADMPRVDNSVKVHDLGGLYTATQRQELEDAATEIVNNNNVDFVIVTTNNALGRTVENYARDFYEANSFGLGSRADGLIFSIDMDNRNIHISTHGKAKRIFTDNNIDYVLDAAIRPMQSSAPDFYNTTEIFLQQSKNVFSAWPSYRNGIIALSFGGGILVAVIIVVIMWFTMHRSSRAKATPAHHYVPGGAIKLHQSNDRFISTHTSHTAIPRSNNSGGGVGGGSSGGGINFGGGSSTSSSSSGGSYGGGSRSF